MRSPDFNEIRPVTSTAGFTSGGVPGGSVRKNVSTNRMALITLSFSSSTFSQMHAAATNGFVFGIGLLFHLCREWSLSRGCAVTHVLPGGFLPLGYSQKS